MKLSPEQEAHLATLIRERNHIYQEVKLLERDKATYKEAFIMERDRLFPLENEIKLFWQENGYSDMLVRKDGYVGLKSLDGGMALPAVYEDICLTYDDWEFFYQWLFVVKRNGKWGLVDKSMNVQIPFEYDKIFRKPGAPHHYILIKDGKQGVVSIDFPREKVDIMVPVEMDAIYHVPGWDLTLFTKDGKWGWWFPDHTAYYKNYCYPECDEIFVQPIVLPALVSSAHVLVRRETCGQSVLSVNSMVNRRISATCVSAKLDASSTSIALSFQLIGWEPVQMFLAPAMIVNREKVSNNMVFFIFSLLF